MRIKIKNTLKLVEVSGMGVLTLVLLALSATHISAVLGRNTQLTVLTYIMVMLVLLSLIMAFAHLSDDLLTERAAVRMAPLLNRLQTARFYFGIALLAVGSVAFFGYPEYFHTLIDAPIEFWNLVSIYSLPAICIEGGLFTLFTEFLEHERKTNQREYLLLTIAFLLYTFGSITANFLTIEHILTVNHQIWFARMIILVSSTIGATVFALHKKSKPLGS